MWMKKSYSPAKGIVAGLVGGLFASWVMNQFQAGMGKITGSAKPQEDEDGARWSGEQNRREGRKQRRSAGPEEEPATMKAAVAVSESVFQHELEPEELKPAGELVHYLYGGAIGALYGWAAERSEVARMASGTLFGAAVWFGSDEIGVPMFGLSKAPTEYPLSTHASALASHLVYGVTTELVRRSLRRGYLAS
jgi:putative membrane protein